MARRYPSGSCPLKSKQSKLENNVPVAVAACKARYHHRASCGASMMRAPVQGVGPDLRRGLTAAAERWRL